MRALALALLLSGGPGDPIDKAIDSKAGGPLAPRAGDAEFLRRATLDLAGTIPSADEARKFLTDADPGKREKLIDRLLTTPDYARRMGDAFTVMFLERRPGARIPDRQWDEFVRKLFGENVPWDEIVRRILVSDGREPETRPAMKFLADASGGDAHRMTQDVSRLFLGKNILCAQCHDHPSVGEWKQAEYMGLYAYLNQSKVYEDGKTKQAVMVEGVATQKVEFSSVFSPAKKNSTGPRLAGGEEVEIPAFEKGKEFETPPVKGGHPGVPMFRPRERLAADLTAPGNRQFARSAVNRLWFLLLGRGLIHPLDLDHKGNAPSHPELLEALTDDFVGSKFDIKRLLRKIALSEVYQRSSVLPGGAVPPASYRVARLRALSAEQMAWSLMRATGVEERILAAKVPEKSAFTMKDYLNGKLKEPPSNLPDVLRFFAETFGNAPGDPEVEFQPSMTHALFLMNERMVLGWLEPGEGNLVARLEKLGDPADELYLSVLTRMPDPEERAEVAAHLVKNKARRAEALGELAWALMASAEFRLNH